MSMNKKLIGIFSGAILLLFFFILPAEYGYDPTGIGKSIGILNFSKNFFIFWCWKIKIIITSNIRNNNFPKLHYHLYLFFIFSVITSFLFKDT